MRKLIVGLAMAVALTLAALASNPAAAACSPPGDHWKYHTNTYRSYWDWDGFTSCWSANINPNFCKRNYNVTYWRYDWESTSWRKAGFQYQSLKCYWYDGQ